MAYELNLGGAFPVAIRCDPKRVWRVHVPTYKLVLTMSSTSTSNPSSIFEDGKLKPGIYKIQNLHTDAYVDIHEHLAREMHLHPAQDLREGKGLVRRYHLTVTRIVYLTIGSGKSDPLELAI